MPRRTSLALFVFAFLVAASSLSAQDVDRTELRQKIAAQKFAGQVEDALSQSRKLDPADAKRVLRETLDRIKDNQDLMPALRDALIRRLQARIRVIDVAARPKEIAKPKPTAAKPDLCARLILDREQFLLTLINHDRDRAAIIGGAAAYAKPDIEFPPDWKPIICRFPPTVANNLTDNEKKLLKTLNAVLSVDFEKRKLKSVIEDVEKRTGLAIKIDEDALRDAEADLDKPVTFKVEKGTVRAILKKVLGEQELTYIIKEGGIQVTTPERAARLTSVRAYPIEDLLGPVNHILPPWVAKQVRLQAAQQLIQLIQQTIEPNHWQPNGPGVIVYHDPTQSFVIRASAEIHFQFMAPHHFGSR